jgi:tryptophanyl-tRNA synthetase
MPVSADPRPRILSGVQPSGKLHLGNYFGAIRQHIALQDQGEAYYFIADYHALTTLPDATAKELDEAKREKRIPRPASQILAENVRDVALDYLALGLDSAKATFYRQSDVPEVTELAWFLATVTGMGLLERATSYKDKTAKGIAASVGLFTYPLLMAADILIVRSHLVPVGKDQVQHLEMTRDIAGYFNAAYGEIFPMPAERLAETPAVPGIDGQKMSKSYGNTIEIFAEGKALEKTVMAVVTDSTPVEAPKNPDTCNVFALYRLFASTEELEKLTMLYRAPLLDAEDRKGRPFGYGDAKKLLLAKIDGHFAAARERRKQLAKDPGTVEEVLTAGAKRAREVARTTLRLVRQAVGIQARPIF